MSGFARLTRLALTLLLALTSVPLLTTTSASALLHSASSSVATVSISPPIDKITLGPGLLEARTKITVINNTQHRFTANIELVDFKSLNENGGLTLGQVGVPLWKYGLANWMTISSGNSVSLAPNESTILEVNIQNRSDLTPGGHYGAVLIKSVSPASSTGSNNPVAFSQNLVSLIFVKKLGGEQYGLRLKSLNINRGLDLPQSLKMNFQSTGNVYVVPRGYIEVTDPNGKLIEKGIINTNSNLIMQGSSSQLLSILSPVASSNLHGRYKLTAYYRYEGRSGYNQKSLYFNRGRLSPLIFIAVIIGLILSIIFSVHYFARKRKRQFGRSK